MTEAKPQPTKRPGRPPKKPELGKRANVMFRLNDATREALMSAAKDAGRSMSEEIERRVEESLLHKGLVDHFSSYINSGADLILGGRHNLAFFVKLSDHIFFAEQATKKSWLDDAATKKRVVDDLSKFLQYEIEHVEPPLLSLTDRVNKRLAERAESLARIVEDEDKKL